MMLGLVVVIHFLIGVHAKVQHDLYKPGLNAYQAVVEHLAVHRCPLLLGLSAHIGLS